LLSIDSYYYEQQVSVVIALTLPMTDSSLVSNIRSCSTVWKHFKADSVQYWDGSYASDEHNAYF